MTEDQGRVMTAVRQSILTIFILIWFQVVQALFRQAETQLHAMPSVKNTSRGAV